MVESFVDLPDSSPNSVTRFRSAPGEAGDMLVAVLDEVIYQMDTAGHVPADAAVKPADDGGLEVRFSMVDAERAELIGAVPKAVSLHELRFQRNAEGWFCSVTLDV